MPKKKPRLCNVLRVVFYDALIFFFQNLVVFQLKCYGISYQQSYLFITCSFSPSINFGHPGRGAELVALVTLKRTKILWTIDFGIPRTLLISLSLLPALSRHTNNLTTNFFT